MAWPLIKHLPDKTNLRFVGVAKVAAFISVLAVIGSLFLTVFPMKPPCGGLNCGVDFRGGTVLELTTAPRPVDLGTLRSTLGGLGLGDVQVQEFGSPSEALVRYEAPPGADATQTVTRVRAELERRIPGLRVTRNE